MPKGSLANLQKSRRSHDRINRGHGSRGCDGYNVTQRGGTDLASAKRQAITLSPWNLGGEEAADEGMETK